jgi:CheY-like chemotaxis protein
MKKLQCILLVDDDEITNFINHTIIEEMQITEHIEVCENGKIALDYLEKSHLCQTNPSVPSLILLDLNMPVMDGLEFLQAYQSSFPSNERCKLILTLTTTLLDLDAQAIDKQSVVTDYLEKPLTSEKMEEILKQHFTV